ncbi:MAG: hypothetical protein CMM01_26545 [Rhodopirellula sp.]|nr:hypothetical protein [Rhodopirellula sp.]
MGTPCSVWGVGFYGKVGARGAVERQHLARSLIPADGGCCGLQSMATVCCDLVELVGSDCWVMFLGRSSEQVSSTIS